jgi:UDP-N-acetylglucosamine--N-acetylmuramyl-(pentapeptide) pyrophosphoryl-undecaprenol N-acetylglucosamine transferase
MKVSPLRERFKVSNGRVMIIGGGTGGHISPGVPLYEEFNRRSTPVLFLSSKRDKRFNIEKDVDESQLTYYGAPAFPGKNIFKFPFFVMKFIIAVISARKIISKKNITSVIAMGGYVSAPALVAAIQKKCRVYLCEQNTVPGRVITLFEKRADAIFGTFEETVDYLKNPDIYKVVGNPIRKKVLVTMSKIEARKKFHLGHCKRVILAIGGSQGALALNEMMLNLKKDYPELFKDTGVIWSTGSYSYETFKERVHEELDAGSIYLSPFIDDVGTAYRAADLAISRSGAGVMMELAAMGVPSILIPYPYATQNHQEKNAESFVEKEAAVMVKNNDANADAVAPILKKLFNNERTLFKMTEGALNAAMTDSAEVIADEVLK